MSTEQQKRIFVTGGSGFVGSVVVEQAVRAGYAVRALSRGASSDARLQALGATPVRGDLSSVDVLEREAAASSGAVAHLGDAFLGDMSAPYACFVETDGRAVDAMVAGLAKSDGGGQIDRLFITTTGSTIVGADPAGGETDESWPPAKEPLTQRILTERYALSRDTTGGKDDSGGVRVVALRLAMFVHGRGASGTAHLLRAAQAAGEAFWVGDGATRVTAVQVDDAARAYVGLIDAHFSPTSTPARPRGPYNVTAETHVTARALTEACGRALGLPARSVPFETARARAGDFFARFLIVEDRGSSARLRRALGWEPVGVGLLADITEGSYVELARSLAGKQQEKED